MTVAIRTAVAGSSGQMGSATVAAIKASPRHILCDLEDAQVVIAFSTGPAAADLATRCSQGACPSLVIGTTELSDADLIKVRDAARKIPIIRSVNFSIGANLLARFVGLAAAVLEPEEWDVEILDAHAREMTEAPSKTSVMFGEAIAACRGVALETISRRDRSTGRAQGGVGFAVVRAGSITAEHTILFAGQHEVLSLRHIVDDESIFARGALAAASWAINQAPGEYGMQDVMALASN